MLTMVGVRSIQELPIQSVHFSVNLKVFPNKNLVLKKNLNYTASGLIREPTYPYVLSFSA